MKEFLEEQKSKIEEELKQLYKDRARSSVETEGSYDIMIDRKKRELAKIINDLDGSSDSEIKTIDIDLKNKIKSLIVHGKIKEAIESLMNISQSDQLILLSSRYNRIQNQYNSELISQANFSIQLNKIANSLLSILKES